MADAKTQKALSKKEEEWTPLPGSNGRPEAPTGSAKGMGR